MLLNTNYNFARVFLPLILVLLISSPFIYAIELDDLEFDFGIELRTHSRHSENTSFRAGVPPGNPLLPPSLSVVGFPPNAELKTVEPGKHIEVSAVTLFTNVQYQDVMKLRVKVDLIDRYDRNSTSEDKNADFDEFWLRLGQEVKHGALSEEGTKNFYLKIGKFTKFERQADRHLESYGLSTTAFNRFEDQGFELGMDLTPNIYVKGSWTAGNPVFIRDPNALAGDNGTPDSLRGDPELNNGIVIHYDAEVEDLEFHQEFAELGLGVGFRFGNESATRTVDLLLFGYERDLRKKADLVGTRYNGDLDVFDTPAPTPTGVLPDGALTLNGLESDYKREYGVSLWVYFDNSTVFAQFVSSDLGGLDRIGWELELSHKYYFSEILTVKEMQLFQHITPVFRFSKLDPKFSGPSVFPSASVFWDWEKIDVGVRMGLLDGVDLTVEYAFNEFVREGRDENTDEVLTTLRWRHIF